MTAYYNEFDPFAAQWLRELIKEGHIAPGTVDERDIRDVKPNELRGFTQCHFFAGIGVWSYALRNAGWPDSKSVWTGSCPCQPFSAAGKRGGFDDERHLWPAFHHLIAKWGPSIVFGEQVGSKDGAAWFDLVQTDMEASGYAIGAANTPSAGLGAPHIRQRIWFVAESLGNAANSGYVRGKMGNQTETQCAAPIGREDEGRGWHDFADDGTSGRMADTESERVHRFKNSTEQTGRGSVENNCSSGRLGESNREGLQGHWRSGKEPVQEGREGTQRYRAATGEPCGVAQPDSGECDRRAETAEGNQRNGQDTGRAQGDGGASGGGGSERVADSETEGLPHRRGGSIFPKSGESVRLAPRQPDPGPVNGLWRDADWLFCRDGKWRAVESLDEPVSDGIADKLGYSRIQGRWSLNPLKEKAEARVGRLKCYGNAINAEAAKGFIEAYQETKIIQKMLA